MLHTGLEVARGPDPADVPRLRGDLAVVTGAAVGIGWAISQRLAREGFALALVDKSDTVLARKAELDELGHPCSDGAAFITGAVIDLNGGGFMAP